MDECMGVIEPREPRLRQRNGGAPPPPPQRNGRPPSHNATPCSSALTKNVMPTRQSSGGKWLTPASNGVPIRGATTNMMLLIELSAPMVTPCSRGSTALETPACSAGPAAKDRKLARMIAYIIHPCCARP